MKLQNKKIEMRVNQYLAHQGIVSRREADEYIALGKVLVNGKPAVMGQKIIPGKDTVTLTSQKKYVYYAYNKSKGVVTTNAQRGETDIIHKTRFPHKVFPVGRLDKDSHGLIVLTNDRKLTTAMLGPQSKYDKEYSVTVEEKVTKDFLDFLKEGVRLDDGTITKKCTVAKIAPNQFSIILTEGKNRQIRRMVDAYKYHVRDLKRVRIGKILLKDLAPDTFRPIATKDIF